MGLSCSQSQEEVDVESILLQQSEVYGDLHRLNSRIAGVRAASFAHRYGFMKRRRVAKLVADYAAAAVRFNEWKAASVACEAKHGGVLLVMGATPVGRLLDMPPTLEEYLGGFAATMVTQRERYARVACERCRTPPPKPPD